MTRSLILLPEAEAELAAAYAWYEARDAGLGDEFLRCIEAAFSRICEHPLHYPVRFDEFRRILARRFPYAVYFEHDDAHVWIYCVFHCAQHPERLRTRLGDSGR